ncbi:MAG TPA: VOC family protein [Candidatus Acidoferrales bacterium]|nr:VOC family protein [Candidatus Acidoferrales bacterium]
MASRLSYVIKFVADMDRAVAFYRDTLGFPLKFQSPGWSEFISGETTLALHAADADHPAGGIRLGLQVPDLQAFYEEMTAQGIRFTMPPTMQFGVLLAEFLDSEGAGVSVSGGQAKGSWPGK